ncbi:MAG: hypothetical protein AB1451_16780 [Nitrospirota bacterium]
MRLAEILSSMGIISILSANPLLGFAAIGSAAYAYVIREHEINPTGAVRGGVLAATSMGLFAVLGFPVLIELVVVVAASGLLRSYVLDDDRLQLLLINGSRHARTLSDDVLTRLNDFWPKRTGPAETV